MSELKYRGTDDVDVEIVNYRLYTTSYRFYSINCEE